MEKSINHNQHDKSSSYSSYKKLALDLSISFVVMYGVMFLNAIIIGTAIVVFFGTPALLRYQVPIKDVQWMKAMIERLQNQD